MNRIFSELGKYSESSETASKEQASLATVEDIEINLRSSCLACAFAADCAITETRGTPDRDVLLGSYRFLALKDKCLV